MIKYIQALIELLHAFIYWRLHRQSKQQPPIKKILVMCYCGLGDMIFLFPMIRSLRLAYPGAQIFVLTNPSSAAAEISKNNTDINEIINHPWTEANHQERQDINNKLEKEHFDAVIITSANPIRHFLPGLHKIPIRIGHLRRVQIPWSPFKIMKLFQNLWYVYIWQEELFRKLFLNRTTEINISPNQEHDIVKCLKLAQHLNNRISLSALDPVITISPESSHFADHFFKTQNLKPHQVLGLSLGMSKDMLYKQWGVQKLARLAHLINERFHLAILLLGSPNEKPLADEFIAQSSTAVVNAIGQTNIDQMAALLKLCRLFISNDTGPAKLSMALSTPTAMIWGPSDRYGGGSWNNHGLVIHNSSPCSPCLISGMTLRGHGIINYSSCGHRQCLNDLSVEFAFEKIERWMNESKIF